MNLWDSFNSSIHTNTQLSKIDKFNHFHFCCIMRCHGLYRSSFLVFVLLSCYVCLDLEPNQEKLTTNGTLGSYFGSLLRCFSYEKGFNLFYDSAVTSLKQDATLPSWDPWNLKVNEFTQRRSKHKRSRRLTQYYANSVATTCLILQHGDIEINPGPVNTE